VVEFLLPARNGLVFSKDPTHRLNNAKAALWMWKRIPTNLFKPVCLEEWRPASISHPREHNLWSGRRLIYGIHDAALIIMYPREHNLTVQLRNDLHWEQKNRIIWRKFGNAKVI
jgi:hypothetical protein